MKDRIDGPSRMITTREDLKEFLIEDARANGLDKWKWRYLTQKPSLVYLRALRHVEYYEASKRGLMSEIFLRGWRAMVSYWSLQTGISIPPSAFGKGLCIPHYGSIVVNRRARFGEYCCIQNNVNIGGYGGGYPTGGDFVYIAPGAVVYGSAHIGNRAVVGANAVVARDVPASTTYAGAPAVRISGRDSTSMMPKYIAHVMSR